MPRANLLFTVLVLTYFNNPKCTFSLHSLEPRKHTLSAQLIAMLFSLSLSNAQHNDVLNDCGMLKKWHIAIPAGVDGSDAVTHICMDSLDTVFSTSCVQILRWETKPAMVTQHTTLWERPTHTPARYCFVNWECRSGLSFILHSLILVFVKWGLI